MGSSHHRTHPLCKPLLSSDPRKLCHAHLLRPLSQRLERKVRRLIELEELFQHAIDDLLGLVGREAILPEQLGKAPPLRGTLFSLIHKFDAIPDGRDVALLESLGFAHGELEALSRVVQDGVDGDED